MTNSASDIRREIEVKEQSLEKFYKLSVQYFGTVVSDEGSKPEVLSRIAQTIASLTK